MSMLTGLSFWIMCGIMWILATPAIVEVINAQNFTGLEALLMGILPWGVLLGIVGRILFILKYGGGA